MMNTKKINVPTPQTHPASHADVLIAIRSCCLATSLLATARVERDGCIGEQKQQAKHYGALFQLLFKRRPTPDEMYFMIGGSSPVCTKCKKAIAPNNNGTMNVVCSCEKEDR